MDLSVTQRLLHPGPDSAMLAPRPPFFLGSLPAQHFSQQGLQVRKSSQHHQNQNKISSSLLLSEAWEYTPWIFRLVSHHILYSISTSAAFLFSVQDVLPQQPLGHAKCLSHTLSHRLNAWQKWVRTRSGYYKQTSFSSFDSEWCVPWIINWLMLQLKYAFVKIRSYIQYANPVVAIFSNRHIYQHLTVAVFLFLWILHAQSKHCQLYVFMFSLPAV